MRAQSVAARGTARQQGRRETPANPLLLLAFGPPQPPEGSSSIGRAPVSKTGGWGFESLLPCSHNDPTTRAPGTEAVT
jgi:hypothetical protein